MIPISLTPFVDALRHRFDGRRTLCVGGPVAALTGLVREVRALGARKPLLLATETGTGELPSADEADWIEFGVQAQDVMAGIREYERLLRTPPASAAAAIDAYDPDRTALAVGHILLGHLPTVAGRPCFGARRESWVALEDKVVVDALWDRIGVPRAPSRIVAVEPDVVAAAVAELDRGAGVVLAGDARGGPHGGASLTRWVTSQDDRESALAMLGGRCSTLRVMPFLDGIPCSIHGIVFEGGESVFRPVELITLRRPADHGLVYAGASTLWDPGGADRAAMRALARRTACHLRDEVGFRGAFTVDGILTADGFLPTELNPRIGLGLLMLQESLPDFPLGLVALLAAEGGPSDGDPADLERVVVEAADRRRTCRARTLVTLPRSSTEKIPLAYESSRFRRAGDGETARADLCLGPSLLGGFVSVSPAPDLLETGDSFAPWAARAFAFADAELGTSIGALQPARDVRRGQPQDPPEIAARTRP